MFVGFSFARSRTTHHHQISMRFFEMAARRYILVSVVIVIDDPAGLTTLILQAIKILGIRAIVSRGWSKLGNDSSDDQVFYLGDSPHEWLFQHVSAVVHHGGAGTTACGLRFGRPTAIVPFFGEYVILSSRSHCYREGQGLVSTLVKSLYCAREREREEAIYRC